MVAAAPSGRRHYMTPSDVRELARKFGIRPSRSFGQNFMVDANATRRIVKLSGINAGDSVVEVGAGLGSLTIALASAAAEVTAVEVDRKLIPALFEVTAELPNVRIVEADALRVDFETLTRGHPSRLVSNLPYNIATPLIAKLIAEAPEISDFCFVVQREAGERFVATPGSKAYGAISVMVRYYCRGSVIGKVPRTVFWPQPSVESVIVRLSRTPPGVQVDPAALRRVVRAAFSQRRKTIKNSLAAGLGIPIADAQRIVMTAGLDPQARAEMLSLTDFGALTLSAENAGLLGSGHPLEPGPPV